MNAREQARFDMVRDDEGAAARRHPAQSSYGATPRKWANGTPPATSSARRKRKRTPPNQIRRIN